MKWEAKIEKVLNGYIMTWIRDDGEEESVLFEQKGEDSKEHIIDLFYDLIDFFGENMDGKSFLIKHGELEGEEDEGNPEDIE